MKQLKNMVKAALPHSIRRPLRQLHRNWVFRRAMRRFLKNPGSHTDPHDPIFLALTYGWGNECWSGLGEYLAGCIAHAQAARGPILECGSGLSTILVGAVARQRGHDLWSLEHTPEWSAKVQAYLNQYGINSVKLCTGPLKDYGEYCWYDPPLESMPESFALVICDGPPGKTPGGRYGLGPVMNDRLKPGCVILLDDAGREPERAVARRWQTELVASSRLVGSVKPYFEMVVSKIHDR